MDKEILFQSCFVHILHIHKRSILVMFSNLFIMQRLNPLIPDKLCELHVTCSNNVSYKHLVQYITSLPGIAAEVM